MIWLAVMAGGWLLFGLFLAGTWVLAHAAARRARHAQEHTLSAEVEQYLSTH